MKGIGRFSFAIGHLIALVGLILACQSAQATPTFVGSFKVDDGPSWTINPPVYSARQAAALLFGGDYDDYLISTNSSLNPNTITQTAHYDGWGESDAIFGQDFFLDLGDGGYNSDPGTGNAWSAYVSDHSDSFVNYVWRNDAPDNDREGDTDRDDKPFCDNMSMVPEPNSLALLGTGGLPLLGLLRRRVS